MIYLFEIIFEQKNSYSLKSYRITDKNIKGRLGKL